MSFTSFYIYTYVNSGIFLASFLKYFYIKADDGIMNSKVLFKRPK